MTRPFTGLDLSRCCNLLWREGGGSLPAKSRQQETKAWRIAKPCTTHDPKHRLCWKSADAAPAMKSCSAHAQSHLGNSMHRCCHHHETQRLQETNHVCFICLKARSLRPIRRNTASTTKHEQNEWRTYTVPNLLHRNRLPATVNTAKPPAPQSQSQSACSGNCVGSRYQKRSFH